MATEAGNGNEEALTLNLGNPKLNEMGGKLFLRIDMLNVLGLHPTLTYFIFELVGVYSNQYYDSLLPPIKKFTKHRMVHSPSLLQLAIDNTNPKPSLEVCRHHLHPEIWPLLPVRHQETQQQPSTLDSTAPCFHLGRTTRYHLHSRVFLERRRLSPSLSISVVHSTIFAPAPAFRHPASAKHHSACRRSSFSSCCCRILHRLQSSSPTSDCHFLYCACFVDHCCFCFISATSSTIAASASGKNLSTGSIVQLLLLLLLLLAIHKIINVVENIISIATIANMEMKMGGKTGLRRAVELPPQQNFTYLLG
ncbi:hypothetical protein LXL04_022954 [Taraxacum kok-saghyz]